MSAAQDHLAVRPSPRIASENSESRMSPTKRSHDGTPKGLPVALSGTTDPKEATEATSQFMPMFEVFKTELDEHHDRRERVIKASRDITALSKKM
jgi:hypothetical protein